VGRRSRGDCARCRRAARQLLAPRVRLPRRRPQAPAPPALARPGPRLLVHNLALLAALRIAHGVEHLLYVHDVPHVRIHRHGHGAAHRPRGPATPRRTRPARADAVRRRGGARRRRPHCVTIHTRPPRPVERVESLAVPARCRRRVHL
ncbi:hypothetical protein B0H12DRAFT_1150395, partial [Mycena haematopus]